MKLTYPGPLEAVSIPSLGLTVKRGGSADVPDEAAPQLLDQGWQAVPEKSPTSTTKKSPTSTTKKAAPAATKEP